MNSILDSHYKSGRLAHGYIFYGERDAALKEMEEAARGILGLKNESLKNYPDFCRLSFKKFGVKDAAEIKEKAHRKGFFGSKKVFLLDIGECSREAENALLKIFEEPPPGNYFLVFTPSLESISQTLRSRLVLVRIGGERRGLRDQAADNGAFEFLKLNLEGKINFLESLNRSDDKEKIKKFFLSLIGFWENDFKLIAKEKKFGKLAEIASKIKKAEKGMILLEQNMPFGLIFSYVIGVIE